MEAAKQQLAEMGTEVGKIGLNALVSCNKRLRTEPVQEPRIYKRMSIEQHVAAKKIEVFLAAKVQEQLATGRKEAELLQNVGELRKEVERLSAEKEAAKQHLARVEGKTRELAPGREAAEERSAVLLTNVRELMQAVQRLTAEKEAAKQAYVQGEAEKRAAKRQLAIAEKVHQRLQQLEANTRLAEQKLAKRVPEVPALTDVAEQQTIKKETAKRTIDKEMIQRLTRVIHDLSRENRVLKSVLLQDPSLRNKGSLLTDYVKERGIYEFL